MAWSSVPPRQLLSHANNNYRNKNLSVLVLLRSLRALSTHHCHRLPIHPHPLLLSHPWAKWTTASPWDCHARHHVAHTLTHAHWRSNHTHSLIRSIGSHHGLLWPPWLRSAELCWGEEPLGGLVLRSHARRHQVSSHAHLLHAWHLLHALHPHARHPLDVLACQVSLPVLFSLGERHIERLGYNNTPVHLGDRFRGFLGCGETHKAETLRKIVNIRLQGRGKYLVVLFKVKTGTIGNFELIKW